MKRGDLLAEGGPQGVESGRGVGVLAIALVEEEEGRASVCPGKGNGRLKTGFHVAGCVHQQDGRIRGREPLDDFRREVGVSGGID